MSKKVIMLSVAVLFGMQAGLAMAANPDTGPGCGLGKLAWADYAHQKNIAPQVLMATTNGTFGSGTFGISSGTSGCTNDGKVMAGYGQEPSRPGDRPCGDSAGLPRRLSRSAHAAGGTGGRHAGRDPQSRPRGPRDRAAAHHR